MKTTMKISVGGRCGFCNLKISVRCPTAVRAGRKNALTSFSNNPIVLSDVMLEAVSQSFYFFAAFAKLENIEWL